MHGCRWTQAASGAAGRANVWLYLAFSLIVNHQSAFNNKKAKI